MFSYRHAFHAGNHADVLKHTVLIAVLKHLTLKEAPLAVFDTHAGAGLYRLDGDYALTSGEAKQGFFKLVENASPMQQASTLPTALQDYVELVESFNSKGSHKVYPGSPFITQRLLRPRDKLKLFELHPTDAKTLAANIAQLEASRQVTVLREDGFEGLKQFLPPPQRRAIVLIDPSYEIKTDYTRVLTAVEDGLHRFATGVYIVWYPLVPRTDAHELPRRLKTLAVKHGKTWLHAQLVLKTGKSTSDSSKPAGLPGSGVFVFNPPFTLHNTLSPALEFLASQLAQDHPPTTLLEANK